MENNFDSFKAVFPYLEIHVKAAKRIYFTKYLLIEILNLNTGDIFYFQKTSGDLRKCYKSVKTYFKNFPIEKKRHDENLKNISDFAKEELENKNSLLIEFLFAFFYKTRNYTVFSNLNEIMEDPNNSLLNNSIEEDLEKDFKNEKEKFLKKSDSVNNINQKKNKSGNLIKKKSLKKNISNRNLRNSICLSNIRNRDKKIFKNESSKKELEKVLDLIFRNHKNLQITNFYRLCNFEKIINKLQIETHDYEILFKNMNEKIFKERFLYIDDFCFYFYKSKKRFVISKDDFVEIMVVLRIGEISFERYDEEYTLIKINNKLNFKNFQILINSEKKTLFLLRLVQEILKKKSKIWNVDNLPDPCKMLGNFMLIIKKTDDKSKIIVEENQKIITIQSEFFNIEIKSVKSSKTIIFPILNIYEVFKITTNNKNYILETQKLFEQENSKHNLIKTFEFFNIYTYRDSDYFRAYLSPPLINYHENRKLETAIKENIKELKLCTFRMKRCQSIRSYFNLSYSQFLNFKYPRLTSLILLMIAIFNIFFSFTSFIFYFLTIILFYNNQTIKQNINYFITKFFVSAKFINKDFIEPKYKTERWLRKEFYSEMDNLEPKIKRRRISISITEHFRNTVDFSSRVSANIHFYIDYMEKIRNIFVWKNPKKTQLFFFVSVILCFLVYVLTLGNILIIYIVYLFWKGRNYYKKLKNWNEKVLVFFLNYFLYNIFEFKKNEIHLGSDKFFDTYINNQECKEKFSKDFTEMVEKYCDIKFQEDFWIERFSKEKIINELLNTDARFIFPFYEEKRKVGYIYDIYNFVFSTPSDLYNYNLKILREKLT